MPGFGEFQVQLPGEGVSQPIAKAKKWNTVMTNANRRPQYEVREAINAAVMRNTGLAPRRSRRAERKSRKAERKSRKANRKSRRASRKSRRANRRANRK
jgi:hypothetical protein